jgi:hypothetical protein
MERKHKVGIIVLAILGGLIFLAMAYAAAEVTGLIIAGLILFVIFMLTSYFLTNFVILNEMEVGVVFDRFNNFVCFLDNDYGRILPRAPTEKAYDDSNMPPKRTKPTHQHHINAATEVLKGKLKKGSFEASGVSKDIRTREGIQVTIPWSVSFRIEVLRIHPGIEHKLARALPEHASKMVAARIMQVMQHIVGQKSIQELYATPDDQGAVKKLEDELREQLLIRAKAIGITGITPNDVRVGPVELPRSIEATLRVAYQRELNTETLAKSLNALREVLAAFTPDDIARLTELERLRIIDEKTKSLILTEPFMRGPRNMRYLEDEVMGKPGNGKGEGEED